MGELYVCSHALALIPYYIETIALNVYSLEELCYYLKQNMDLVDPSFMDEELIEWIKTELKMPSLANRLTKVKTEGGRLLEFVAVLVSGCSYCTKEELKKMQEMAADFENKSETECRKIRADRLLSKKRYGASILEYRKLLDSPDVSGILSGDIYHNMGTAYAGLFLFREAAGCYEKAYNRNRNPISMQLKQMALQLEEGKIPHGREEKEESAPEEVLEQWKDAYIRNCK